jgi:hypothetical protein
MMTMMTREEGIAKEYRYEEVRSLLVGSLLHLRQWKNDWPTLLSKRAATEHGAILFSQGRCCLRETSPLHQKIYPEKVGLLSDVDQGIDTRRRERRWHKLIRI